jgi:hypothetical protein
MIFKKINLFTFFHKNSQFDFEEIKRKTLAYVTSMKVGKEIGIYKYSQSTTQPNIYASVYACLIRYLYGDLKTLSKEEKRKWLRYFDSYQSKTDGLFYDPVLKNNLFAESDWWGARHLALHIIMAYQVLGTTPKYKFKFLEKYYQKKFLQNWLDQFNWQTVIPAGNDLDNKIMNIGCLLQYSRDYLGDDKAATSIKWLIKYLRNKINPVTGMWGNYDLSNPDQLSRMIQFAYHLFQIFFYDKYSLRYPERAIDCLLKNQNKRGGFSPYLNSSACEDIDSTELLIHFSKISPYKNLEVKQSLKKALRWILSNINNDGGFVFRKEEAFNYGHQEMSSKRNESSLFATWFRTVNLAHLTNYLGVDQKYEVVGLPGYDF